MKKLNYILSLICSVLVFAVPVTFIAIYGLTNDYLWLIAAGIGFVIALALSVPISKWRQSSRVASDHDEFGNSKKKRYEKLSQKERDMIDLQKTADAERLVGGDVLRKMTHKGSIDPQKDLDNLIGLAAVKQKVAEMAAKMEFEKQAKKDKKRKNYASPFASGHHAVYFGAPGTGKTSVARIMTGYLYKYGYIKENKVVEVDGNFLKAGSETAAKTTLVVRHAFGGVLFVDEAYALAYGDQYGLDAVATIIKQMEDNRDRFVLILAGYTDEMRFMLEQNPGFESRIKDYLFFENYSDDEMCQIFTHMARSLGYTVNPTAMTNLRERFNAERPLKSFGNARTARSVLDEALEKHAFNFTTYHMAEPQRYELQPQDILTIPRTI